MSQAKTTNPNIEDMVLEFITTFKASLDFRLWMKLVREEVAELLDASRIEDNEEHVLKELVDVMYVVVGASLVAPEDQRVIPADEWADITADVEEGEKTFNYITAAFSFSEEVIEEAIRRVHASNMSKLDDDGKPILREDGKIMKGPNYRAPDLSDLV